MRFLLVFLLYALLLFFDFRSVSDHLERNERIQYLILAILALFCSVPAAYWAHLDHAGASLSGMLSQFIS